MAKLTPDESLRLLLDRGESLLLQQIEERLQIGERQIRRIIRQFQRDGIPIQERRDGRYKVFYLPADRQQVPVPDLRFDAAELRALTVAAKASRSVLAGTPHTEALNKAFDKLLEGVRPVSYVFDLDEPMQEWHFDDSQADQIVLSCFGQLEHAMDERRSVRIDYQTGKDGRVSVGRKIDPYCFARRKQAWMLMAYCHQRQAVRTFALGRISQVTPCDDAKETAFFEIKSDFMAEDYFRASLGAITAGECYVLRLLVEPEKALFFRQRKYHETQEIEEDRVDGRLVVSYEVEGFEEMRSFCQGWGTGITVLSPDELRNRLRQEAEELVKRYQPSQ